MSRITVPRCVSPFPFSGTEEWMCLSYLALPSPSFCYRANGVRKSNTFAHRQRPLSTRSPPPIETGMASSLTTANKRSGLNSNPSNYAHSVRCDDHRDSQQRNFPRPRSRSCPFSSTLIGLGLRLRNERIKFERVNDPPFPQWDPNSPST